MKKLNILALILIIGNAMSLLLACKPSSQVVTYTQKAIVTRIDTVGDHLRYHIVRIGNPYSSVNNRILPGDTIPILTDQKIRQ